jgi:nucleoside-diphosphate-sugar epimerase
MILVTGANGFVGSALIERLVAEDIRVRAAVRTSAAASMLCAKYPQVDVVTVGEIGAATAWRDALAGIDSVVHLASRVHVMRETEPDPLRVFRSVNTEGSIALARAAATAGVKRFIYLSTVKVIGERTEGVPFSDASIPYPSDPYAISKQEAEAALFRIESETSMCVTVLRPPLVYGAGVKGNFLRLLAWIREGYPLPLGAIHNQRSLLYLGNLVDAIVTLLVRPVEQGRAYVLRDGTDVSTPDLIRRLAKQMDVPARLLPIPAWGLHLAGQITGRVEAVRRLADSLAVDDTRFRHETGWAPRYTLDQGLSETVHWYLTMRRA